jgi:hypothetical protein
MDCPGQPLREQHRSLSSVWAALPKQRRALSIKINNDVGA